MTILLLYNLLQKVRMNLIEGLSAVFSLIERAQLTETEQELIQEIGFSWSGLEIDCDLLNIAVKVIKIIENSNSVIYNYITKLDALMKEKGCGSALYDALNPPILGASV